MKNIKFLALGGAVIAIILGVIARVAFPEKILFGLAALTYLRLTAVLLLFAMTFHLLFKGD